jgi:hypothetical protein
MPDLQRHIVTLDATTNEPTSSVVEPGPFEDTGDDADNARTTAIKLGQPDGLDEEVRTGTDALGRPISGGQTLTVEYFIRDNADGTEDAFVTFCQNQDSTIWVLETYQEHEAAGGAVTRVIGAPSEGCTVTTRTREEDGMPGTIVSIATTSIVEGTNYRTEPGYAEE